MSFRRVFSFLFVFVYLAVGAFALSYLYDENDELRVLAAREEAVKEKLHAMRSEVTRKNEELSRMSNDREYIERVIRGKLNYSKENELIFRFE